MESPGSTLGAQRDAVAALLRRPPRPAPLLWPAIALMAGIWLSDEVGAVAGASRGVLLAAPVVAFALILVVRRYARGALGLNVLVVGMALAVGFLRHQVAIDKPPNHVASALGAEPVLTRVAGRIVTAPIVRPPLLLNPFLPFNPPPRTQFVLALDELRVTVPPTPVVGNVRVNVEAADLNLQLGQRVQVTGKLYLPVRPQNPGEFDWSRWYQQQGIDVGLSVEGAEHVTVLPEPPVWSYRLVTRVRSVARSLLFEPYADWEGDPSGRLLDTMVLGQRSAVDQKINEAFLRAGGMHFLAVSGFNVTLLAGATWWFVRRFLRQGSVVAAVSAVVAILLFSLVAEPNAPILRATVAGVLVALAAVTRRPMCVANWLALAAGFVLLCNPLELFRAGFQLSFFLVAGLYVFAPDMRYAFLRPDRIPAPAPEPSTFTRLVCQKLRRASLVLALVSMYAWLISCPLVMWHFQRVAPWGWLGALLATPLVTAITLLSFVAMLAHAVVPPLGALVGAALHHLTDLLLWLVDLFNYMPHAVLECQRPPLGFVAASYAALALVYVALGRSARDFEDVRVLPALLPLERAARTRRGRLLLGVAGGLAALGTLSWIVWPTHGAAADFCVHVLAVGNGNAALLTTPDGHAAVIDVGTDTNSDAGQVAVDALRTAGLRRVEAALLSHANFDHYSGLPTLWQRLPVDRWMTNAYFERQASDTRAPCKLLDQLPPGAPPPEIVRAGDRLHVGDAELEVLWPPDDLDARWKANNTALVVRVTVAGRSILLTGDIEREAMNALLESARAGRIMLHADVLVTPHHGQVIQRVTEAFYAAVSPSVVVVSTRTPRPKVALAVANALGPGVRVIATRDAGAVALRITSDGRLTVETPCAARERTAPDPALGELGQHKPDEGGAENQPGSIELQTPEQHGRGQREGNGRHIADRDAAKVPGHDGHQRERARIHAVEHRAREGGAAQARHERTADRDEEERGQKDAHGGYDSAGRPAQHVPDERRGRENRTRRDLADGDRVQKLTFG